MSACLSWRPLFPAGFNGVVFVDMFPAFPYPFPKGKHILQTLQFLLQSLTRTDGTFYLQCFGEFLPYLNLRRRSTVFIVDMLKLPSAASKSFLQGRLFRLH